MFGAQFPLIFDVDYLIDKLIVINCFYYMGNATLIGCY